MGSVFHCLECPEEGGETAFINMYAVFEALPQERRRWLTGRTVVLDSVELPAEPARALVEAARDDGAVRSDDLTFLPVDRVFSVRGTGTVVTGTLIAGTIREGDEVVVLPRRRTARVRGLEVHNASTREAIAGQRLLLMLIH